MCATLLATQGLEVSVGARDAAAFLADCADLRLLAVSGLGGCVEASAAALACSGVTLKGGPGHACLLHLPGGGGTRGGACPGIEVMHAQRCITPLALGYRISVHLAFKSRVAWVLHMLRSALCGILVPDDALPVLHFYTVALLT